MIMKKTEVQRYSNTILSYIDDWTEMQKGQYKSEDIQYDHFLENWQIVICAWVLHSQAFSGFKQLGP